MTCRMTLVVTSLLWLCVACDTINKPEAVDTGAQANAPAESGSRTSPVKPAPVSCELLSKKGEAPRYARTHPSDEKYVVLGGAVSEIVAALGHQDNVVATDTSSTYPEAIAQKPKVGYFRKINAEGVLAMSPTMLLATSEAGPEATMQTLEAAGVTIKTFDGGESVEGAFARIKHVGQVLGEPECAEHLVRELSRTLDGVEEVSESLSDAPPRVLFIYARGANMVMVSGEDTPAARMLELAGMRNAVEGFEGFKPLSAEVVLEAQPDLILIPAGGAASLGGKHAVAALPGVSQTEAATQGRVITIDDLALLGFGPRFPHALQELQSKARELIPPTTTP
jgi:iron complex transport system substrate-binding protein